MMRISYDALINQTGGFHGWSFDQVVRELLRQAANQVDECECAQRGCIHAAAADIIAYIRLAERSIDCPTVTSCEASDE